MKFGRLSDAFGQIGGSSWPVLVVTLKCDEARRGKLLEELTRGMLDFELVVGVDGRRKLPQEFERKVDRASAKARYGRSLSDAELACGLSHRMAYERILENGWAGGIVLEDDALLSPEFFDFVRRGVYKHSDLILLFHSHARVFGGPTPLGAGYGARLLAIPACGTVGYSVSADAARYLLEAGTPLRDVADWPGDITKLRAVAVDPPIVGHGNDIAGSHIQRHRTKTRPRYGRFLEAAHWQRWWRKQTSCRIS